MEFIILHILRNKNSWLHNNIVFNNWQNVYKYKYLNSIIAKYLISVHAKQCNEIHFVSLTNIERWKCSTKVFSVLGLPGIEWKYEAAVCEALQTATGNKLVVSEIFRVRIRAAPAKKILLFFCQLNLKLLSRFVRCRISLRCRAIQSHSITFPLPLKLEMYAKQNWNNFQ